MSTNDVAAPKESLLQTLMPVIVLTTICAIAGLTLSALKIGTAEQIENQLLANVQGPVIKRMFPDADNDPIADKKKLKVGDGEIFVFPVYEKGQLSTVAIEGLGGGYGGDLGVMVGFNLPAGTIRQVGVTISKETPGIGTLVQEPRFTKQFVSLEADKAAFRSNGGSIDAISGSTISSNGAVLAVRQAGNIFKTLRPEIEKTWPAQK